MRVACGPEKGAQVIRIECRQPHIDLEPAAHGLDAKHARAGAIWRMCNRVPQRWWQRNGVTWHTSRYFAVELKTCWRVGDRATAEPGAILEVATLLRCLQRLE